MAEKRLKVLIADDDPQTAKLLQAELKRQGFETVTVADGQEAVKRIKTDPPDAVVLDLMMPKFHGFEVCRMVKGDPTTKDVKVLILTARAYKPDQDKAMELGADAFILKPFEPKDVVKSIKKLVKP